MWIYLGIAIVSEVIATLSLRQTQGFTQPLPSAVVIMGYIVSFYSLSQALQRGMAVSTAYTIWCGVGITTIAILGTVLFGERPTYIQLFGIGLVTIGVLAIQSGAAS